MAGVILARGYFGVGLFWQGLFWFGVVLVGVVLTGVISKGLFWQGLFHHVASKESLHFSHLDVLSLVLRKNTSMQGSFRLTLTGC